MNKEKKYIIIEYEGNIQKWVSTAERSFEQAIDFIRRMKAINKKENKKDITYTLKELNNDV